MTVAVTQGKAASTIGTASVTHWFTMRCRLVRRARSSRFSHSTNGPWIAASIASSACPSLSSPDSKISSRPRTSLEQRKVAVGNVQERECLQGSGYADFYEGSLVRHPTCLHGGLFLDLKQLLASKVLLVIQSFLLLCQLLFLCPKVRSQDTIANCFRSERPLGWRKFLIGKRAVRLEARLSP